MASLHGPYRKMICSGCSAKWDLCFINMLVALTIVLLPVRTAKSIGKERTYGTPLTDAEDGSDTVTNLAEMVVTSLNQKVRTAKPWCSRCAMLTSSTQNKAANPRSSLLRKANKPFSMQRGNYGAALPCRTWPSGYFGLP